jgi:general secretion pathway protein D
VELKLTIKPQINESDYIRMAITEQTEEIASTDPVLGPTTSKRSAKTTVVAKDQETVVIGGIMQERTLESVSKVPILGDVPLLGHLFRSTNQRKTKTNLLLFLTPYIIREQSDFRRIFERKMNERQQFVEQFYGQVAGYDVPVDFERKTGPLGRMRRTVLTEEQKVENGGPGMPGDRVLRPSSGAPAPSPAPSPGASTVAPGEVSPGAGGLQTPAATETPEVQPPPAPPPENPERLRIQPDTGDQE